MTVARLLSEADSLELSRWQRFKVAQAKHHAELRERAKTDAAILGPDG